MLDRDLDTEDDGPGAPDLQRVVTAARVCFAERGIAATRMADVARRAGISRPHLYSFVAGRSGLLELVAMERLAELGAVLEARAQTLTGDIAEAFVDQIVAGSKLGHDDPEFTALAEAMQRARLNFLLTSRGSALHAINAKVFAPLIGRAVAEGRLRPDITTDALVEWLQGVMALLAGREDFDEDAQREMLRRFVLPGVLR